MYIPDGVPPVISSALARVERRLPQPGEILIRKGGRVEPEDIVARAMVSGPPQVVNLARGLGLGPEQAARAVVATVGAELAAGALLARGPGPLGRRLTAPIAGTLSAVDAATGYALITPAPQEVALSAAVRGVVMDVIGSQRVVIETLAAQVTGVCGFGGERSGVLSLLTLDPESPITAEMIDAKSAYAIIIGGSGISAEALRKAVAEQVRGVIVGGIAERELREFLGWAGLGQWQIGLRSWQLPAPQHAADPGLTIVLTEGLGERPMAAPLFELLAANDRQEALIEGQTRLRRPLQRPRVVIPLARSSSASVEPPRPQLRAGAQVRLLDPAHLGQIGQVRALPSAPRRVASGARAAAVEVVIAGGEAIWLPRSCVEVLA